MADKKESFGYSDSSYPNTERTHKDSADSTDAKNIEKVSEAAEIYKSEVYQTLSDSSKKDK
ncbi:MAG: hypothetical protein ABL929_10055 [Ferruginibacter sp.]|nr:hypothetical protein [Ferruginibacter sp.]